MLAKRNPDGSYSEAQPPFTSTDTGGQVTRHPHDIERKWSAGELALLGLFRVTDDPQPSNERVTGSRLVERRGEVFREWITEPLPVEARRIAQETVVRRLQAMFLMDDVHREFVKLTAFQQHLWFSLVMVDPTDPQIIGMLQKAGLNSEQIAQVLAPG